MPRGKTHIHTASSSSHALADIGYQGSQIADATGLPARTVDDIINGRNGWAEIIANNQAFKQYRTQAKTDAGGVNQSVTKGFAADRKTESTRLVRHKPRWSMASCATRSG